MPCVCVLKYLLVEDKPSGYIYSTLAARCTSCAVKFECVNGKEYSSSFSISLPFVCFFVVVFCFPTHGLFLSYVLLFPVFVCEVTVVQTTGS